MRHVARKGLFTIAAAGGMLVAAGAAAAQADAGAEGAATNSPGIGSGNTVQAPVDVPVNACGNTVNVGGLLNPAYGNTCVNDDGGGKKTGAGGEKAGAGGKAGGHATGGHSTGGGAQAQGQSSQSPGVLSGNTVQAPVDVPVNVCGNSANVAGVGNAVFGNECGNGVTPEPPKPEEPPTQNIPDEPDTPEPPRTPDRPDVPKEDTPPKHETQAGPPAAPEQLAETGAGIPLGAIIPLSGGLLLGGAVLYRRARAAA
ncbi:chaplin [Streptomyces sp. MAR4 CNY-716]